MENGMSAKTAISLIIAGLLLLALGIFVGFNAQKNWFPESEDDLAGSAETEEVATTSMETSSPQASSNEPKLSCAEALKRDTLAKKTAYSSGSILVTFKNTVDFDEARKFVDSKGLRVENASREGIEEDYESSHWLTVTVPKGEEFDWICALRGSSEIRYAGINPTFELAQ